MADDTKPDGSAPGESEPALAGVAPAAPAPARSPRRRAPRAATGASPAATPRRPRRGAAAGRRRPRPPAAPLPDLAGKTTTRRRPAARRRKAAVAAGAKPAAAKTRDADDTSPLLTRRAWMGLAWGAFSAASAAALAATGRFMFPNVLNEPPQQFKAGFPNEYGHGRGRALEREIRRLAGPHARGHRRSTPAASTRCCVTCTHLGCTPNYLSAESKFKCPCHGSGFRTTGINFEGPAPRPLERARIVLADDGQILVDKSRKFQCELGQWTDPEAFLKA